ELKVPFNTTFTIDEDDEKLAPEDNPNATHNVVRSFDLGPPQSNAESQNDRAVSSEKLPPNPPKDEPIDPKCIQVSNCLFSDSVKNSLAFEICSIENEKLPKTQVSDSSLTMTTSC